MGRGRPKKDNPKNREYRLRMSDDELQKLKRTSDELGITMSDLVRTALNQYYLHH